MKGRLIRLRTRAQRRLQRAYMCKALDDAVDVVVYSGLKVVYYERARNEGYSVACLIVSAAHALDPVALVVLYCMRISLYLSLNLSLTSHAARYG